MTTSNSAPTRLSTSQEEALHAVLHGGVVHDSPTSDREIWSVLSERRQLNGRTMWSLHARGYITTERERGSDSRFWRHLVTITREGRMALGLPGVDLDAARMRLRLYLIQHDMRAESTQQGRPGDAIHTMTSTVDGQEHTVQLRASDIERVLDALDGHL